MDLLKSGKCEMLEAEVAGRLPAWRHPRITEATVKPPYLADAGEGGGGEASKTPRG